MGAGADGDHAQRSWYDQRRDGRNGRQACRYRARGGHRSRGRWSGDRRSAAAGFFGGTVVGAGNAYGASLSVQSRYDIGYMQCMYARGNRIPVSVARQPPNVPPAPPPPPAPLPPGVPPPPAGPPAATPWACALGCCRRRIERLRFGRYHPWYSAAARGLRPKRAWRRKRGRWWRSSPPEQPPAPRSQ